jgi:HEAT repeat protein
VANHPTLAKSDRDYLLAARHLDTVDLERVRGFLTLNDDRTRVLARRVLAARHVMTDDEWASALTDSSSGARRDALEWLAREEPDDHHLPLVRGLLADSDALVCEAACFALGELGDVDALDVLCDIARRHEDPRCREAALGALGALGDPRATETVIAALEDKPSVRRRAVVALAAFEGPEVDAALERAREDRDWQVRAAVDQLDPHGLGE